MTPAPVWSGFHRRFADAVDLPVPAAQVVVQGDSDLPSAFAVTDFAVASLACAGQASARLASLLGAKTDAQVVVDRRLASLWFDRTIRPVGWELPGVWDEVAGIYRAQDRFIRLHTNAPHHRRAAISVLGCADDRKSVTDAVSTWDAFALHEAIVDAGGVAAALRSREEWVGHAQGQALAVESLVHREIHEVWVGTAPIGRDLPDDPARPLAGVRVLDLTRVLAGPVSTRWLAGLGADVLRIDPPWWDEPGVVPDVNLGKRCARLDLTDADDRERFEELIAGADIVVHGYRPGALAGLGYDPVVLRRLNPGLVDVSLNAWGHTGPWSHRRGFDSIVQVGAGVADHGRVAYNVAEPRPLPVQALDHATGYTMAACALQGWHERLSSGHGSQWRTSLAAHAEVLWGNGAGPDRTRLHAEFTGLADADLGSSEEVTSWGPVHRARPPMMVDGIAVAWVRGASNHGTESLASWSP